MAKAVGFDSWIGQSNEKLQIADWSFDQIKAWADPSLRLQRLCFRKLFEGL